MKLWNFFSPVILISEMVILGIVEVERPESSGQASVVLKTTFGFPDLKNNIKDGITKALYLPVK